jgi:hypothetical protein
MLENFKKSIRRKRKIKEKLKQATHKVTTMGLIRMYIASKLPQKKEKAENPNISLLAPNPEEQINHIAVILDGKVEDVIRAQNRMAALFLSEPVFVEFDPREVYPKIGITEYIDGVFVNTEEIADHSGSNSHGHEEENQEF